MDKEVGSSQKLTGDQTEEFEEEAQAPHDTKALVTASPPRDPAADRHLIAKILLCMMAVGLVGHYSAVIAFYWTGKSQAESAIKSLETILNAWLPVVSGLVGSAVTYYFTREK